MIGGEEAELQSLLETLSPLGPATTGSDLIRDHADRDESCMIYGWPQTFSGT